MIYNQVVPNTIGWNQVKSEFERNVKIFLLLQESPDESIRDMATQNAELMQKAFHNMNCKVDGIDCKCSKTKLVTEKKPMPSEAELKEWNELKNTLREQLHNNSDLPNSKKLPLVQQLESLQAMDYDGMEKFRDDVSDEIEKQRKDAEAERVKKVENNKKILTERINKSNLDDKTKTDLTKKTDAVDAAGKESQITLNALNQQLQELVVKQSEKAKEKQIESETSDPDNPNKEE